MTYICFLAALFASCEPPAGVDEVKPFEIVEIGPGIYAALANIGGTAVGNAGILDMGNVAVVFDTGLSPQSGGQIRAFVETVVGKSVRFVINSHFHDDHVGGNQAFSGSSYFGTSATQRIMTAAGPTRSEESLNEARGVLDDLKSQLDAETDPSNRREIRLMTGYFAGIVEAGTDFERVPPTVVWDSRLNFSDTLRSVKIVPVGTAHTEGDAALWSQADSVLFTGDLVVTDRHPRMRDGDPDGWSSALDTLLALDFNVLVPGHGPLGDRNSVFAMKRYLEFVEESAVEAAAGTPVEEIPMDSTFAGWMLDSQFRDNVRFVMEFRESAAR